MTEWVEVLKVLVDGPRVPVRGIVRTMNAELIGKSQTFGFIGAPPLMVGIDGHDVRVWRDGRRVRVEQPDGTPLFITDGETAWQFGADGATPTAAEAGRVYYHGPGAELLITRSAAEWLSDDFTRPARPVREVEYLGRRCWDVELAPPEHKPHPMQMVVDRDSGAVLEQRSDAFGFSVGFTEFAVGEDVDDSTFAWRGDAISMDEARAADRAAWEASRSAIQEDRRTWFTGNVADPSFTVSIPVQLTVSDFDELDEGDGGFSARLTSNWGWHLEGTLLRRPRGPEPWNPGRGLDATIRRWSTERFDWACWLHGIALDDVTLAQLQAHLHPGEDAVDEYTEPA